MAAVGIFGQDWSSYQVDAPSTDGLDFAFVKVTEGLTYLNPRWPSQRDHAKQAGLVWGAYHYPHMANSVQAEADHFLAQVTWQDGDVIVLDWEGYDDANKGLAHSVQATYKDEWLRYVKSRLPGHRVGTYCNTDYLNNIDATGYFGDFLWIATAGRAAGDPGIASEWLFHQYGDAPVDQDYCRLGSRAELAAWAGGTNVPAWPGRELRLADPMMRGQDVHDWQQRMADRGWHLDVDGWFGLATDRVCRQFQTEKGIGADGIVGPVTWTEAWTAPVTS